MVTEAEKARSRAEGNAEALKDEMIHLEKLQFASQSEATAAVFLALAYNHSKNYLCTITHNALNIINFYTLTKPVNIFKFPLKYHSYGIIGSFRAQGGSGCGGSERDCGYSGTYVIL